MKYLFNEFLAAGNHEMHLSRLVVLFIAFRMWLQMQFSFNCYRNIYINFQTDVIYWVSSLHYLAVSFIFSSAILPCALGFNISFTKDMPPELSSLKQYSVQNQALRSWRFVLGVLKSFKMKRQCYHGKHGLRSLIPAMRL